MSIVSVSVNAGSIISVSVIVSVTEISLEDGNLMCGVVMFCLLEQQQQSHTTSKSQSCNVVNTVIISGHLCFSQHELVGLHPSNLKTTRWSLPVFWWGCS